MQYLQNGPIESTRLKVHSSFSVVESFLDLEDASNFLEKYVRDYRNSPDWMIREASINFINHRYRVGFMAVKAQGELFSNTTRDES